MLGIVGFVSLLAEFFVNWWLPSARTGLDETAGSGSRSPGESEILFDNTVEDISLQLGVEVRVRITSWMRNRHPLAAGLGRLCRRREKVPFADGEADDLDTPLKMLPLAGDLTAPIFLIGVEGLVGERPAKLVR